MPAGKTGYQVARVFRDVFRELFHPSRHGEVS
jgi:hypothetical protein